MNLPKRPIIRIPVFVEGTCPPWITARYSAASREGSNLEKVVAMGLLLRHADGRTATAWRRGLEEPEIDELLRAIAERCQQLDERLAMLRPEGALRMLRDVDDLESILAVLGDNDFALDAAEPVFDAAARVLPQYRGEIARCEQLRAALHEEDSFIGRIA